MCKYMSKWSGLSSGLNPVRALVPFEFGSDTPSYTLCENCQYSDLVRIQSECGKIGTRKTPNADTFRAMIDEYEAESFLFEDTQT